MNDLIRILLVEDDLNLGFMLREYLEQEGFDTKLYRDGESGLQGYLKGQFDLCILDLMLPKMDGFRLAEKIREDGKRVPVIMLTARSMSEDKVKGFSLGIDDYVTKPFDEKELVCRINAILQRVNDASVKKQEPTEFTIGSYSYCCLNQTLSGPTEERRLTKKEAAILKILCEHKNEIVDRSELLKSVWGDDDYFMGRSLDVFISKLRKYLKDDPNLSIESIPSVGLILNVI
ncbi:response regulator transcription factor [Parvicella tangerina]|uniref:Response regulator ArlR n=1 Tax=Parvicella tangerina TaxID=2829795 RepID=A0A916JNL7_9FLAO|nr:response regulator transcription factor [Parvicella tangerina]CAG5082313.1 Response regulator ArlR [Parvicella tangerina]